MADQEETNEETQVQATDAAEVETTDAAEATQTEATEAGPELSAKEQRRQTRHAEASKRPSRTPEERQAERVEERARKARLRRTRRLKEREARKAEPKATPPAAVERPEGRKKVRQGIVVSDKADKTITVRVDAARRHRRYEKIVRSSSTLHVHDESNEAHEGDTVRVVESRPLSRLKRWKLVEVVERAR
jgi:small subunit ribosomal protein S17